MTLRVLAPVVQRLDNAIHRFRTNFRGVFSLSKAFLYIGWKGFVSIQMVQCYIEHGDW